jgi:hypothetical protein
MTESRERDYVDAGLSSLRSVSDAAQKAGSAAQGIGSDALAKAAETAHDVQTRASELGTELASEAASLASVKKNSLAERLDDVADAFGRSGEVLQGKEDWLAHLIEQCSEEMKEVATSLRSNDFNSVFGNLQNLARRQPALFMGTSVAAGFALARVGRIAVAGTASEKSPGASEVPK